MTTGDEDPCEACGHGLFWHDLDRKRCLQEIWIEEDEDVLCMCSGYVAREHLQGEQRDGR